LHIETSLEKIAAAAVEKEEENLLFRTFLNHQDTVAIDQQTQKLNSEIEPKINCTECGNCCKSLMITLTEDDCTRLAPELNLSNKQFKDKYTEQGLSGNMLMNAIPCHFLAGTKCSVYEHRFSDCREFPGISQPNFVSRSFSMLMHYGRCPIVYNVWEQLKVKTGFV
jgi:uncharacterized protein